MPGVDEHLAELDEIIGRLARAGGRSSGCRPWTCSSCGSACFELAHRPDVPTGVVLSEAVDLAGRYGTDDSSRFVNGLLASAAAAELRPPPDESTERRTDRAGGRVWYRRRLTVKGVP